ncbi:MAG: hypothetical protein KDE58_42605, partial [Caldilineaceae bacterium]|nr:hypothetical protein [Caldilineaceae bacterium]
MSDWPTDRAPTQWRQRIVAVALALLLFLGMAAALRQVAVSIPGSPLYGIKTASERTQGMLMSAGGEGARWHAEQTVRRLHELSQLTAQTTAQAPTAALVTSLTHEIESHTQQALAGSTQFSSAEQQVFLEQWYEQLAAVEKEALRTNRANRTTVDLMQQVSAQILSA